MTTTATMNAEEQALTDAREELLRARDAMREFRRANGAIVGGKPVFFCRAEQRLQLDAEYAALERAENEAHEKFQTRLRQWSESKVR